MVPASSLASPPIPGLPEVPSIPGGGGGKGCAWYDVVCSGTGSLAGGGLNVITNAVAGGAQQLLDEIVKVVDASTQVPLLDPTYRRIYMGFLGLAAVVVGVILCVALIVAAVRRDPATLNRAVSGIVIAGLGGGLYIVLAQFLVAVDNWLSSGVVRVTGHTMTGALTDLAHGFGKVDGQTGELSANMLLIVLMMVMLIAGLVLWFVLVLRQIAILVVVAFAPLLIGGYLWGPTRGWVRRTTEVLVALVFTKTAIFAIFGIGLALLARGDHQSLSSFVGALVLVIGACFAPLMMLRLVHFAADTQLAGEVMGTLKGGMRPVMAVVPTPGRGGGGRQAMARHASQSLGEHDGSSMTSTAAPKVTPWEGTAAGAGSVAAAAGASSLTLVGLGARKASDLAQEISSPSGNTADAPGRDAPTPARDASDGSAPPRPRNPSKPATQPPPRNEQRSDDASIDPPPLHGPDGDDG